MSNKTALNADHVKLGGTMVDFGGWEMPLWYPEGAIKEHLAVIRAAGLFDTSHMVVVLAEGPNVRDFLDFAITKDLSNLQFGRVGYGVFLDESGFCVDDTVVYAMEEDRFGIVLNSGMGTKVLQHIHTLPGAENIRWTNLEGKLGKIDLQGPESFRVLKDLVEDADAVFQSFPYFRFQGDFDFSKSRLRLKDGTPILLSRTGYTGELGFEIFLPCENASAVWNRILQAGKDFGLIPCGYSARDSLRTGAALPLSRQDIGNWVFLNNPWTFALPFGSEKRSFTKDFCGASALIAEMKAEKAEYTFPFVGFDPRKVDAHQSRVFYENQDIGTVLTAVADVSLGRVQEKVVGLNSPERPESWTPRGLVCGFLKIRRELAPGTVVQLTDSRRSLDVEITRDIRPERTARKALR